MRVLVGGIGYRNLRDHSFGVLAVERLAGRAWPPHVSVEDISYGPIAVVQRLEDDPPDRRFSLAIVVGAVARGRPPGTLSAYRWDNGLPDAAAVQAAVAEAVTGVIALDNTMIVARHFDVLPPAVVIEAEPAIELFGQELSPALETALDRACDLAVGLALDPLLAERLPVAPLGGGAPMRRRPAGPTVADVSIRAR